MKYKTYVVYAILDENNNHIYYGSTGNIKRRMNVHRYLITHKIRRRNKKLYEKLESVGELNWVILYTAIDKREAKLYEELLIRTGSNIFNVYLKPDIKLLERSKRLKRFWSNKKNKLILSKRMHNKVWLTKNGKNKRIDSEDVVEFLNNGWKRGIYKHK